MMRSHSGLADPEPPQPDPHIMDAKERRAFLGMVHDCSNCLTPHKIFCYGQKVKCGPTGVKLVPEHCSSWRGSADLADDWPQTVPCEPKKFANRRARG